jgi:hypothetical protein
MVDTRRLKTFIKLGDLDGNDIIEFVDEGKIVERDFSKAQDGSEMKTALTMKVSLNGEEPKELTLNNTTINILRDKWGSDTANWVGRRAKVTVVETLAFGQLKEVNVLKPIADEPPPAPAPMNEAELDPDPAPAQPVNSDYCACPAGQQKPTRVEKNGQIWDECTVCNKPILAWDE